MYSQSIYYFTFVDVKVEQTRWFLDKVNRSYLDKGYRNSHLSCWSTAFQEGWTIITKLETKDYN